MEEFGQEYIQIYCNDVLDGSLALIKTALCSKKNIEFCVHNQEQFINLQVIIDDIFNNFIYYYYAYGDNYSEHPCYNMEFDDCAEVDTPPYLPNCYRKEAKSYYTSLLASENIEIRNDTMFEVKYEKKSDDTIHISFTITEKEKVQQALAEYLYRYSCNEVYNEYENTLDYETQKKQFFALITKEKYNYNNFHVNDIKYIKAILACEHENQLWFERICFDFNDNDELSLGCIIIIDVDFINLYKNALQDNNVSLNNDINNKLDNSTSLYAIKKLSDIEVKIISARAYLETNSPERVTYKKIARFLTDNDIHKISENGIKQNVSSMRNKLGVQDLGTAVTLLRDANCLITFENLDK